MQIFTVIALCSIILLTAGITDDIAGRLGMNVKSAVFAAFSYIVLSGFEVMIGAEICINAAALFLPLYLFIVHITNLKNIACGGFGIIVMEGVMLALLFHEHTEYVGIAVSTFSVLTAFLFRKAPIYALFLNSMLPIIMQLFISVFDYMRYSYASCELSGNAFLNIQLGAVALTAFVLICFFGKRAVIKA